MLNSSQSETQTPSIVLLYDLQHEASKVTGLLYIKPMEGKRIQEGNIEEVYIDLKFSHHQTAKEAEKCSGNGLVSKSLQSVLATISTIKQFSGFLCTLSDFLCVYFLCVLDLNAMFAAWN